MSGLQLFVDEGPYDLVEPVLVSDKVVEAAGEPRWEPLPQRDAVHGSVGGRLVAANRVQDHPGLLPHLAPVLLEEPQARLQGHVADHLQTGQVEHLPEVRHLAGGGVPLAKEEAQAVVGDLTNKKKTNGTVKLLDEIHG